MHKLVKKMRSQLTVKSRSRRNAYDEVAFTLQHVRMHDRSFMALAHIVSEKMT